MECNKEEAIRAKCIAENKMQNKDFVGARKIALKAQQLYPELENVAQMLTVCEVHCSAGIKVNGETDWYGILQVQSTADDSIIKKQYRKLALLLHPDKNKFGGAEAAFKLVGEAHRTLSDKGKRSLHDMKRGTSFTTVSIRQSSQQPNRASSTKKQPFSGLNQQPPASSTGQTFWTICPHCAIRYQYYQSIMNRQLRCQSCMKPFIAYDFNAQAAPSAASWNRSGIPKPENPGPSAHYAGQKSNFGNASGVGSQGNMGGGSKASGNTEFGGTSKNTAKEDGKVERDTAAANEVKFEKVKLQEVKKREKVKPSAGSGSQRRRRNNVIESSDAESSDSDVVIEDVRPQGQNGGTPGSNPRRSNRHKQNISYNEKSDDDNCVSPKFKRLKRGGGTVRTEKTEEDLHGDDANGVDRQSSEAAVSTEKKSNKGNGGGQSESLRNGVHEREHVAAKGEESLNTGANLKADTGDGSTPKASEDADMLSDLSYPDPEFCDFEKERDESNFAAEQIWAVYDNVDGMPRFYARIKQVHNPEFKLLFNWLESVPTNLTEAMWSKANLPIGCGTFKLGKLERTQDRRTFSHLISWTKGTKRNSYVIYPRKGEVWALFKDWTAEWGVSVDNSRQYEYEVVEILSDFTEGDAISVVHLVKIKGFVGLFVQATDKGTVPLKIQSGEMLRFSHKIPSHKMTGDEREGVPKGSFELDCASLPANFFEMFPSVSPESTKVEAENMDTMCNGLNSKSSGTEEVPTCATNKNSAHFEEMQRTRDNSSNRGNSASKKELEKSSTIQQPAESGKHIESEPMTPKQQIGRNKDNIDVRDSDSNNSSDCHIFSEASSDSPNSYVYPDSEFFNFEEGRSFEKFEQGQIWALYSDLDKYPKYYGRIKKVEPKKLKVHLAWLDYCSVQEDKSGSKLPVSCGTFKIMKESCTFDTVDTFSHIVHAKPTEKKDHYDIYPRVGEIWAVYKHWRVGWSLSDLENCEYDVVEIIACDNSAFKVLDLKKVNGYRAVFMPERRAYATTMEIPSTEISRFSHQIPAFKLTEERGGKLRGYWELDPASVPDVLLFADI